MTIINDFFLCALCLHWFDLAWLECCLISHNYFNPFFSISFKVILKVIPPPPNLTTFLFVSQGAKSIQQAWKDKRDSHSGFIITCCHIVLVALQRSSLSSMSWAAPFVSFSSVAGRNSHCTLSWGPLYSLAPQSLSHQSEPTLVQMG